MRIHYCTVQPLGMDPERGNSDLSSENTTDQSDLDLSCSSSSFDNSDTVEEPELVLQTTVCMYVCTYVML